MEDRPAGPSEDGLMRAKRAAAEAALAMVEPGIVLGLGSGTTASIFVRALGKRVQSGLKVLGVPTSSRTEELARSLNIPLTDLECHPRIDLDVDGADEIDPRLNVLKGGGGALLHEKIVALASQSFVAIADETKLVERIGRRPVPVEVVSFGWAATRDHIRACSAECSVRGGEQGPFVTDSGNMILDVVPPGDIDIFSFVDGLKQLTGVVDHGLFRHAATLALIGSRDGSVRMVRAGIERSARPYPDC